MDTVSAENSGPKQAGGRFRKGQSGNPAGKPKGTRHKATHLAQTLLDGQAEGLVNKAIELALAGDVTALRVCLGHLLPPRKDRPIAVDLPKVGSTGDAAKAMGAILARVAEGELTPTEGQALAGLVESYRKTLEVENLEERLRALEKRGPR